MSNSIVSSLNSTTVALSSNATFTGAWEDTLGYTSLIINIASDTNCTFGIEFSTDASTADSTLLRYYHVDGRTNQPHRFTNTRRYMRAVVTNTSESNQSFLRMQVLLGSYEPLNAPLDAHLPQNSDAIVVRPTDPAFEAALGIREGVRACNKWGYNTKVGENSPETVWSFGGLFTPLSNAETLTLSSTNSYDTNTEGDGARQVFISGVGVDYISQEEVVLLNGTSPVVTSKTWLGVNEAAIISCGASQTNVGTINVVATSSLTQQAEIPLGVGMAQQAFFFVPKGHTACLDWFWLNIIKMRGASYPSVTIRSYLMNFATNCRSEVFRLQANTEVENTVELKLSHPFAISEKNLISFEATSNVSKTSVNLRFSLQVFRNTGM